MSEPRYWVVTPVTWRSGPGHRSHLTRDNDRERKRRALCRVEKNAHGLDRAFWQKEPLPLKEIADVLDRGHYPGGVPTCQRLCANCRKIAAEESEE